MVLMEKIWAEKGAKIWLGGGGCRKFGEKGSLRRCLLEDVSGASERLGKALGPREL